jgi:2-polyprenyl-3-methyl-5-hydroxy-6-metoxy-1,4-benzoquinol methylase
MHPRGGVWEGDEYQRQFDALAASGVDVHGEASFVMRFSPASVLDAGCGTGRVAVELAKRGVTVVGVDLDESMLATARSRSSDVEWIQHDLATLALGRTFNVVLLAGNVPLFTPDPAALIVGCAHHVGPDGALIAGFSLDRGYAAATFDEHCAAAGLRLVERYGTWDAAPFADGDYAVSVLRPTTPA